MVALFVVGTVVVFFIIEYLYRRSPKHAVAPSRAKAHAVRADRFLLPRGYFFSRGHAWVNLLFSGKTRVGVDDFVQKVIGAIDGVSPVAAGTEVKRGDTLFTLRQGNRTLTVTAPVTGKVLDVNYAVVRNPRLLAEDPYEEGWVVLLEPKNIAAEIKLLSVAEEAVRWLHQEGLRFRDFITARASQITPASAGATLLDGGVPVNGALRYTDEQTWQLFEREFLAGGEK